MSINKIDEDFSNINLCIIDSDGGICHNFCRLMDLKNNIFFDYIYEHYFKLNRIIGIFFEDEKNKNNNKKMLVGTEISLEEIIKNAEQFDWRRMEKTIDDLCEKSESSKFCIPDIEYYKRSSEVKRFIYIISKNDIICMDKKKLWDIFIEIISVYGEFKLNEEDLVKRK